MSGAPDSSRVEFNATRRRRIAATASVAVAVIGLIVVRDGPRYLQWEIAYADTVVAAADRFAAERLSPGVLPILANPDLGKVSYAKSAVIVDLGLLGDPALAALADRSAEHVDSYLEDVAAPDVVELHGGFTCRFEGWVASGSYERSGASPDVATGSCDGTDAVTIWYRTGGEHEYALANELVLADDPAAVVAAETGRCRSDVGDVWRCGHLRRAVLRAAVPLRDAGVYDQVIDAMAASPSWDLDEPSLRRGPGWGHRVVEAYLRLRGDSTSVSPG